VSRSRAVAIAVLLLASATAPAHAEDAPRLRFDPFALPDSESLMRMQPNADARLDVTSLWTPVLRATLVGEGDDSSFANLGGIVLMVGESTEGYRLLEVREWEAVFERGGEFVTLTLQSGAER